MLTLGSPSPGRRCSQSGAAGKEVMLAWKAGSPSEAQYLPHFVSPAKVLCQSCPPPLAPVLLAEVFGGVSELLGQGLHTPPACWQGMRRAPVHHRNELYPNMEQTPRT